MDDMTTLIFLLIFFLCTCRVHSSSNFKFSKVTADSTQLEVLASYQHFRSAAECAIMCGVHLSGEPPCEAFRYFSSTLLCEIYTDIEELSSGVEIYKYHVETESAESQLQFQEYASGDTTYLYHWPGLKGTYYEARDYCLHHGIDMLHIDSLQEPDAIRLLIDNQGIDDKMWVGINDIASENVWVNEKDGFPISNLWTWNENEPNNIEHKEDCGVMSQYSTKLNDMDCSMSFYIVCEKLIGDSLLSS